MKVTSGSYQGFPKIIWSQVFEEAKGFGSYYITREG